MANMNNQEGKATLKITLVDSGSYSNNADFNSEVCSAVLVERDEQFEHRLYGSSLQLSRLLLAAVLEGSRRLLDKFPFEPDTEEVSNSDLKTYKLEALLKAEWLTNNDGYRKSWYGEDLAKVNVQLGIPKRLRVTPEVVAEALDLIISATVGSVSDILIANGLASPRIEPITGDRAEELAKATDATMTAFEYADKLRVTIRQKEEAITSIGDYRRQLTETEQRLASAVAEASPEQPEVGGGGETPSDTAETLTDDATQAPTDEAV